ncbi:hypothetical protein [Frankia nepalensis]|uniref:Uncharacterized protein n=1 Tax=Frankia nepalensis TaxID=1836974 RepID=A0A937RFC0_9ACTN|nr:hypothetical protein [Frankia nepalensis]MBL7516296.1 hypothetical protein [Frankia nepalensis]MBL7629152.1 hypothetical protein [Frankia nepalensis]
MGSAHLRGLGGWALGGRGIASIAYRPDAPLRTPLDSAPLCAVDELIDDGVIADGAWAALAAEFDERKLFDVLFVTGCYETMAWMMHSLGLKSAPDPRLPEDLTPPFRRGRGSDAGCASSPACEA